MLCQEINIQYTQILNPYRGVNRVVKWRAGRSGGFGLRRSGNAAHQIRGEEDVETAGLRTADDGAVLSVAGARGRHLQQARAIPAIWDDMCPVSGRGWHLPRGRMAQEVQGADWALYRAQSMTTSLYMYCPIMCLFLSCSHSHICQTVTGRKLNFFGHGCKMNNKRPIKRCLESWKVQISQEDREWLGGVKEWFNLGINSSFWASQPRRTEKCEQLWEKQ